MKYDVIIIGGGLVGLSTAYKIIQKYPYKNVLLLEKEKQVGIHQSGHNSGVIHSGIYYKPGSLKAKNCIEGYHKLIEFAQEFNIPYELCGKIIVATSENELPILDTIYKRGQENGLQNLTYLSREEFREIEPHCEGLKAVKVPQTGIIDYPKLAITLQSLIQSYGGNVLTSQKVISIFKKADEIIVQTEQSEYSTVKVISCAGLYSDKVAQLTENKKDLQIIPFRGEYYELQENKQYLVNHLIYPVPDPNFPFLGVHFTRMIHGGIEAGPNAVLAFRKEGYHFSDFNFSEAMETFSFPGFWKIAAKYGKTGLGEIYRSLSKSAFTKALQKLIPEITESDLLVGGAGVRAQACSIEGVLLDDFDILKNGDVIHVRNAPSPAATSCLAIGETLANYI